MDNLFSAPDSAFRLRADPQAGFRLFQCFRGPEARRKNNRQFGLKPSTNRAMKRNLIAAVAVLVSLGAQAQTVSSATDQTPVTKFQIVSAGAHENLWQKTAVDDQGQTNVQSYTELATGLNFYDPASSTWQPSRELFQITPDGYGIATNGQHKMPTSRTPRNFIPFRLKRPGWKLTTNIF